MYIEGNVERKDADALRVTLYMTQTLAEWEALAQQLTSEWPSGTLGTYIGDIAHKIRAKVYGGESRDEFA